ncbi:uncharacterized protein LOC124712435 [Schistocerca piceifrons]|uniref:uncharacterized protein LOC124712435 n=1 Tax=Schistocerca piceifrons TaxID=274613 RepID=UPI001F5F8B9A|nr:uncharacterized protein LOC124712435 [Schistocerca piceifrons]
MHSDNKSRSYNSHNKTTTWRLPAKTNQPTNQPITTHHDRTQQSSTNEDTNQTYDDDNISQYYRSSESESSEQEEMEQDDGEEDFQTPPPRKTAKRKNTEDDTAPHKQFTTQTENRFEPLSPPTQRSNSTRNPATSTQPTPSSSNAPQAIPKKPRIPPITIQYKAHYLTLNAALKKHMEGPIQAIYKGDTIKYHFDSMKDQRTALDFFHHHNISNFTHQPQSERHLKVVIKGLPETVTEAEVDKDLQYLNFKPRNVHQYKKRGKNTKQLRPMDVFCVTLDRKPENDAIYHVRYVLDTKPDRAAKIALCPRHKRTLTVSASASRKPRKKATQKSPTNRVASTSASASRPTTNTPKNSTPRQQQGAGKRKSQIPTRIPHNFESPNRFDALGDSDEEGETTASPDVNLPPPPQPTPPGDTPAALTATSHDDNSTPAVAGQQQPTGSGEDETNPRNVPPIVVYQLEGYTKLNKEIKSRISGPLKAIFRGNSVKYNFESLRDYYAAAAFLRERDVPHFNHQPPEKKDLHVVVHGLPAKVLEEELREALVEEGFRPSYVHQFKKRARNSRRLIREPTYKVSLPRGSGGERIYEVRYILHTKVTVETYRPKEGRAQCHRCQRLTHTANYCNMPARCVKCAGLHATKDCRKPESEPQKCVLCSGDHPASWKGCPEHQKPMNVRRPYPAGKRRKTTSTAAATERRPHLAERPTGETPQKESSGKQHPLHPLHRTKQLKPTPHKSRMVGGRKALLLPTMPSKANDLFFRSPSNALEGHHADTNEKRSPTTTHQSEDMEAMQGDPARTLPIQGKRGSLKKMLERQFQLVRQRVHAAAADPTAAAFVFWATACQTHRAVQGNRLNFGRQITGAPGNNSPSAALVIPHGITADDNQKAQVFSEVLKEVHNHITDPLFDDTFAKEIEEGLENFLNTQTALTEEQAKLLAPITEEEIALALISSKQNTAPVRDKITRKMLSATPHHMLLPTLAASTTLRSV